jgi:hypothetical protein
VACRCSALQQQRLRVRDMAVILLAAPSDGRAFQTFDVGDGGEQLHAAEHAVVTQEIVAQAVGMRQALCYSAADAAAAAAAAAGDGDDGGVGDACISSDGHLPPQLLLSSLRRSCRARTCVPGDVSQPPCCLAS